jgi:sialate O-acetylesterase
MRADDYSTSPRAPRLRSVIAAALAIKLVAAAASPGAMALELGPPFRDGAVLQREMPVPVWGWTDAGSTVTVAFAGQTKSALAAADGRWTVALDPLAASFDGSELRVSDDRGGAATVKDVLVGEVWMASGQSNMQWPVSNCDGRVLLKEITERVARGEEKQPVIREGKVTDRFSVVWPIEHAGFEWTTDPSAFSAVSFAFAYAVFREIHVPIGIVNCSFSQTSIQAWTPRVGFRDGESDYTRAIARQILETDPTTPEHATAWNAFYGAIDDAVARKARIPVRTPGNMNDNRDATWLFNARTSPVVPYAIRGCIWNQGYANIHEGIFYQDNLRSLIRGWRLVWNRPDLPVYFHQFYCPGDSSQPDHVDRPGFDPAAEMRLGTWLARDIPHTGMACQIDIGGAIHYFNKSLPGMRLALHALKNHYGKPVVTDGPMYKGYTVSGDTVIVEFEHADDGLVVAETKTNSLQGLAKPTIVPDGAAAIDLFFVADENRVWYPAKATIDGGRVRVSSPKVKAPRGVSYGSAGIGFQPNLYNTSMLPTAPFIVYDHAIVTRKTWPDDHLAVDGEVIDPATTGLLSEHRKLPILSTQFRDQAVLQAGQPVVIWGATRDPWGSPPPKGSLVIHLSFDGVEKTIPVTAEMTEWRVTLPPMEASAEPKTLTVSMTADGELVRRQECKDIVVGDVWYVGASISEIAIDAGEPQPNVRMLTRRAKRDGNPRPSRFSVSVSTAADNRFASEWQPATGFAAALGKRIAAKTGKPVGVVFMQIVGGKDVVEPPLAGWIKAADLAAAPSLGRDYDELMSVEPGTPQYAAEAKRYVAAWKAYWSDYVPAIMRTKAVPDGAAWGHYPTFGGAVTTKAGENYNVLVESLTPGSFKGLVFLTGPAAVRADEGLAFGEQMAALGGCWKKRFACDDPYFFYTMPSAALAAKITPPRGIPGRSRAIEIPAWPATGKTAAKETGDWLVGVIATIVDEAY